MFNTTHSQEPIVVSYLREIIQPGDGTPLLWQAKVTDVELYDSFEEFVDHFWRVATYPKEQSGKLETYGFTPTAFNESGWRPRSKPDAPAQWGTWRAGEHSIGEVSLAYFDLDNHNDDAPMITFDTIEAVLHEMNLSYALYTSYSHLRKDGRHKVRILIPASQWMTYEEAYYVFVAFNHMLHNQLDASIYDDGDHLFGPPHQSRTSQWFDGDALDVAAVLAYVADELPDDAFEAATAQRRARRAKVHRDWSEAEVAEYQRKVADMTVSAGVSITNPAICRPEWIVDLERLVNGGSHRQTLLLILSRIFAKSGHTLSFGEVIALQRELDARFYGYCERKYGHSSLDDDVRSIMSLRGTPAWGSDEERFRRRLAATQRRLSRSL